LQEGTTRAEPERASLRSIQRADTRRRLLIAARTLFRTNGVEAVSMEDIARGAAAARATIYLHFPGKTSLLTALLEEDWAGQLVLFERLGAVDAADREALSAWIMRVVEGMRKAQDSFAIHRAALGQNPELVVTHHDHRHKLALALQRALHVGTRRPPTTLEAEVEASMIVAEIEYFATAAVLIWSPEHVAAGLKVITQRLLRFARQADS